MIVIGEKINGSIAGVRDAIRKRDAGFIADLASSQAEAGADYIDVNVGTGEVVSEEELMVWALDVVGRATDVPVAIDSSISEVLAKGLEVCGDTRPFLNSVNGESSRMDSVLPLAAKYDCPVVALAMDESGIPSTPEERLDVCRRILSGARSLGVPDENLFFDPLVLPISADHEQARITLETLLLIKAELPEARTIIGLSNASFGLPRRSLINSAVLAMAIFLGLDAAIMDPTDTDFAAVSYAAEAVAGQDRSCRRYIKAYREGTLG